MDRADVEQGVIRAVDRLLGEDAYLLERDANERSITHRLAAHLAVEFPGWDVDCEYNRDGHEPKRLNLATKAKAVTIDDEHATTVFPDIIIHRRGTNDENLVVIEAKKTTNADDGEWDRKKLKAFTDQLGYKVKVFILLRTGRKDDVAADLEFEQGRSAHRPPS